MAAQCKLANLFALGPITQILFSYLNIADVYALHGVCRSLHGVVDCLVDTRFNINSHLKSFVDDCELFRRTLCQSEAIITGQFVLNFLSLRRRPSSYLDVLVEDGSLAANFADYLVSEEGYRIIDHEGDEAEKKPVLLQRASPVASTICITKATTFPIHELLRTAFTTADLNFMTWNKVYSIFPVATLINEQFWPLRKLDDDFGIKLSELAAMGWTTRQMVWPDLTKLQFSGSGQRRIGDRKSLIMQLAPVCCDTGSLPDYVIDHSDFEVAKPNNRIIGGHRSWSIASRVLTSPSLRYRYTTSFEGLRENSWHKFVSDRLERWTEVELFKMSRDQRPQQNPTPSHFGQPDSWDYADDQIPLWYQAWYLQRNEERRPPAFSSHVWFNQFPNN